MNAIEIGETNDALTTVRLIFHPDNNSMSKIVTKDELQSIILDLQEIEDRLD